MVSRDSIKQTRFAVFRCYAKINLIKLNVPNTFIHIIFLALVQRRSFWFLFCDRNNEDDLNEGLCCLLVCDRFVGTIANEKVGG